MFIIFPQTLVLHAAIGRDHPEAENHRILISVCLFYSRERHLYSGKNSFIRKFRPLEIMRLLSNYILHKNLYENKQNLALDLASQKIVV